MRKILAIVPVAVLVLLTLSLWGCTVDDEDSSLVGPPVESCSIEVTQPDGGERFLPGAVDSQTVQIRWDKTGPSLSVSIDLLKGDTLVDQIVSQVANSGFYSWRANNMGAEDGNDFSVRVSVNGSNDCLSTSGDFLLLNTNGCSVHFTSFPPDSVHVGDVISLSWESTDLPGLVSIELGIRGQDSQIIETGLPIEGTYDWTVGTFGLGTNDFYELRLRDTVIPKYCFGESERFKIEDPEEIP